MSDAPPPPVKSGRGSKGVAAELAVQAFTLYKLGFTQRQIAKQIGRSLTRVNQMIQEELRRLGRERKELGEYMLDLELRRIDDMMTGILPRAMKGDVHAIDRVVKLQERRARYLGLDKPERHVHAVGTLEDLVAATTPAPPEPPPALDAASDEKDPA